MDGISKADGNAKEVKINQADFTNVKTDVNDQADFTDVKTDGNGQGNFTDVNNTDGVIKKVRIGKTVNIYRADDADATSANDAFLKRLSELNAKGVNETHRFIVGVSKENTPPPPYIHTRIHPRSSKRVTVFFKYNLGENIDSRCFDRLSRRRCGILFAAKTYGFGNSERIGDKR
jgi:hypothetical protein